MSTDDPDHKAPKRHSAFPGEEPHEDHNSLELPTPSADTIARRQLLGQMSVALGVAGGVALGIPMVGFIVAPLFRDAKHAWVKVGKVDQFEIGQTINVVFTDPSPLPWAGVTSRTGAWLRRVSETEFVAFSVNCAHLGCPVRWLQDARIFMCPCHGGVYYEDGSVAAGPPPHPLQKFEVRVFEGHVEIKTEPLKIG